MIGQRIKEAREIAGHTQSSLAELMGINHQQVWRWESGKYIPEAEKIASLAKALNVSSDYLLGLSDDPKRAARESELSPQEQEIIMALRRGDPMEAIRTIASK